MHEPVMVAEVLEHLAPSRGGVFVDCTVGLGGHTQAIFDAGATRVIGLDRDPHALAAAAQAHTVRVRKGWARDAVGAAMRFCFEWATRSLPPGAHGEPGMGDFHRAKHENSRERGG